MRRTNRSTRNLFFGWFLMNPYNIPQNHFKILSYFLSWKIILENTNVNVKNLYIQF